MKLLKIHRCVSIMAVVFVLYLSVTGSLIQLIDLKGLVLHASPYDSNVQAMRGDLNGPGEYAVIGPADYLAKPLPAGVDYPALFDRTLKAARATVGEAPLRYLELREVNGRVEGLAQLDDHPQGAPRSGEDPQRPRHTTLIFDAMTGSRLAAATAPVRNIEDRHSLRVTIKSLHRMTAFGPNWVLWINVVVAIGLFTLIVTGLWTYIKQYRARARMGRTALLWKAQDWWRTFHRAFSLVCALFLTIQIASGLWLAVESLVFGYYMSDQMAQAKAAGGPLPEMRADPFSELQDVEVPRMAKVTIAAYTRDQPALRPRAMRLRVYAGYAQGVVISGGNEARQLVYNARSGEPMLETEPGYPKVGFPFGWQVHQWAKQVHNGSMIGLTGRWISLLSGLALLYLSVSGIVMYVRLWRRRARNGRRALFW